MSDAVEVIVLNQRDVGSHPRFFKSTWPGSLAIDVAGP